MTGFRCGNRELGIGAFVDEEGGYTSVAVALALLVCLALVLSMVSVTWTLNRSADVQPVADATALAGANVVSSYTTVATTLDACVFTLGLAGMVTLGAGLVASAVPGLSDDAAATVQAGSNLLEARKSFALSSSHGLEAFENTLPLAIAARSSAVAQANSTDAIDYVGCAVPFPQVSESDFSALNVEISDVALVERATDLQREAQRAKDAQDKLNSALLAGWSADCGAEPRSLWERADALAGLSATENPRYPRAETWSFGAALLRARTYYARRGAIEKPEDPGVEALTDSACRSAFYDFALSQVRSGHYVEHADGTVDLWLPELPGNSDEMRQTQLYTDARWPCTQQQAGRTLHASLDCPGATGTPSGSASIAELEAGGVVECPVSHMSAASLGKVAAASTSIDNGFEYYWKRVVEASRTYQTAKNELVESERVLRELSELGLESFDDALDALATPRPQLRPPGAWGCVGVVSRDGTTSPARLAGVLASSAELPAGAAVGAATLAPDNDADTTTSLMRLFDAVEAESGDESAGVLGSVGRLWENLLVACGASFDGPTSAANEALLGIEDVPRSSAAAWLQNQSAELVSASGLEPTDVRLRKPVLTNTRNVLDAAGIEGTSSARELVAKLPDTTDPVALAQALGQVVANELGDGAFTVAELPIPGTNRYVALTLDARELLGAQL